MDQVGIRILGLNTGARTAFDGQWLVEYDPTRPGTDPDGRPMIAHIVCSPDPARALRFDSATEAHAQWVRPSGHTRPDGKPDRPLIAFHIGLEALTMDQTTLPVFTRSDDEQAPEGCRWFRCRHCGVLFVCGLAARLVPVSVERDACAAHEVDCASNPANR